MLHAQALQTSSGSQATQILKRGTSSLAALSKIRAQSEAKEQTLNFFNHTNEKAPTQASPAWPRGVVNRSLSKKPKALSKLSTAAQLPVPVVKSSKILSSPAGLLKTFHGIDHYDQRYANGGNQFSLEPPDQGLAVGGGFVLEAVNDALRIYDTSGKPLTSVIDLNTFFGYPATINRTSTPNTYGPSIVDPSCLYDSDLKRWFVVILTLEVDPATGDFTGKNHIDIAVSAGQNPLNLWNFYSIPVQDDGTDGTPNHNCSQGPCIGDYPHIGADKAGFYITTNEYSFFGPEFIGAQIYAISKLQLALGKSNVTGFHLDGLAIAGNPAFTLWPAIYPAGSPDNDFLGNGTEFFLSSMAAAEANNATGMDNRIGLWALTNTRTLNRTASALTLSNTVLTSETYGIPPLSDQKAGSIPLGASQTPPEPEGMLDSNDSRMQQVTYAGGYLYGALDTIVNVGGQNKAGIAYFVIQPTSFGIGLPVTGKIVKQGYTAITDGNLIYPAVTTLANGKGVMAFTLVGKNYYPSAAYAPINRTNGVGNISIAGRGAGPQDGFTEYEATSTTPTRPRWGDYGAAMSDGTNIWIASEFIAQTCTLTQFLADPTCGGTRSLYANWATQISKVRP